MNFDLARVVAVHPEDNSVDLVMVADNARLAGVQVLSPSASGNTGLSDLAAPAQADPNDKWDRKTPTARDIIAVVGYIGRNAVVTGFLFPQVSQVLFKRTNFRVNRHASDWYETIDDAGNAEWSHPSGTYLRFAEDPEHEDLAGKDFDGKWAIARNKTRAPWVSLMVKAGGAEKARVRIDPAGNVTVINVGNVNWTTTGNVTWTVQGNMALNVNGTFAMASVGAASFKSSGGSVAVQAASSLSFTAASLAALVGGGSGTGTVQGNFAFQGTLTSNAHDISHTHTHGGVQTGGGTTGAVS